VLREQPDSCPVGFPGELLIDQQSRGFGGSCPASGAGRASVDRRAPARTAGPFGRASWRPRKKHFRAAREQTARRGRLPISSLACAPSARRTPGGGGHIAAIGGTLPARCGKAYHNLGGLLLEKGGRRRSYAFTEKAIALRPDYPSSGRCSNVPADRFADADRRTWNSGRNG